MAIPEQHRDFLENHRLCVVGFARKSGPPSLSPVYYFLDGDDLVISTTASRGKAKAARRNAEMSVCVLAESFPFQYLTVFGHAQVEDDGAVDAMMKMIEKMTGNAPSEAMRPAMEKKAADEGRVVLRVTPERFVSTQAIGTARPAG